MTPDPDKSLPKEDESERNPTSCNPQIGRPSLLKGSWDLVTRVIVRVTLLRTTYNPN